MIRLEMIRGKLIMLAIVMVAAVLVATASVVWILYQTSITETAERLTESVQSHARIMETIAEHDRQYQLDLEDSHDSALDQIRRANEQFQFGHGGEFTLAREEGNQIVFLLRNHQEGMDIPKPVSFSESNHAEPMRRALNGESGWMIGRD
ncbi:hypothetical protein Ga0123462_1693 [Mariprofundus ferrinatatus]|uniref:Uncharacterized protein n=1 Tax=Mariprofundus ferrinatatus TaxID=1921087 RepID=A0A2K8L617_9PROT|nr:hypothetical protein [Mariprofundus ferrinatatus]ATX82542.1 hypothetical protein Ga0123462_1693 [Mariprofundus ferrinatatus]